METGAQQEGRDTVVTQQILTRNDRVAQCGKYGVEVE